MTTSIKHRLYMLILYAFCGHSFYRWTHNINGTLFIMATLLLITTVIEDGWNTKR